MDKVKGIEEVIGTEVGASEESIRILRRAIGVITGGIVMVVRHLEVREQRRPGLGRRPWAQAAQRREHDVRSAADDFELRFARSGRAVVGEVDDELNRDIDVVVTPRGDHRVKVVRAVDLDALGRIGFVGLRPV